MKNLFKKTKITLIYTLSLCLLLISPIKAFAKTKALDGRTYTRIATGTVSTSGTTTQVLTYRIRYTEYVDSTGSYISKINNIYIYGGDIATATYSSDNGYPKYSGLGSKNVTLSCRGKLEYLYNSIPYSHKVNFKINLNVYDGKRV